MVFVDNVALNAADLNDFDCETIVIDDATNATIIDINKTGATSGEPLDITNAGSDESILINNTSTGDQIQLQDSGVEVFSVEDDGTMNINDNNIENINSAHFTNRASAPSTTEGKFYYNSTDGAWYFYDGTDWIEGF